MVLGARRVDRLEALKAELEASGAKATFKSTDVTQRDQVKALIKHAEETFGPVIPNIPINYLLCYILT